MTITSGTGGSTNKPKAVTQLAEPEHHRWSFIRNLFNNDDASRGRIITEIAEQLDKGTDFRVVTNGKDEVADVFVYHPDEGIYKPDGVVRTKAFVADRLGMSLYDDSLAEKALEKIKPFNYVTMDDMGGIDGKVAVSNGVIDLSDPSNPTFGEHSPTYNFISKIATEWDPDTDWHDTRWEQHLQEVIPDEADRMKLQEYGGYILRHWDASYERAMLLFGPTDSGKSTILDAIRNTLGSDNVLNEDLQAFSNNQFATGNLPGTMANIGDDLGSRAIYDTGTFKKMTSGKYLEIEQKYKAKVSYRVAQKQIYAANETPDVRSPDDAFYNRWLFVEVPDRVPPEDIDRQLEQKLSEEKSAILRWMLEGYKRLMEQGHFTGERSIPEKRSLWLAHGDVLDQWINECVVFDNSDTPEQDAYEHYKDFAADKGENPKRKGVVTSELKEYGVKQRRPGGRGQQTRVYRGMSIDDPSVMSLAEQISTHSRDAPSPPAETDDAEAYVEHMEGQ